jgi:epoxide hydrolase
LQPFRLEVPQSAIEDLQRRLSDVRWPAEIPGAGWDRGVPLGYLKELAGYWRDSFDWRSVEGRLNQYPQFTTEIDGANIHFLHVRSAEPDAIPMIMSHGWPGSVLEFLNVIGPLTDPRAHGGDPSQAYHLVIPSLPGFGPSGPVSEPGWGVERIAAAWVRLMHELGYDKYVTQGGDLGTWIAQIMAAMDAEHVLGAHVNFLVTPPSDPAQTADLGPGDLARLGKMGQWITERSGYMKIQSTRPQTLAYGLTDSPVGQLAWITEKFYEWTGAVNSPEEAVTRDQLLANVSLYWFTATGGSSAQIYYEMAPQLPIAVPPPQLPPPLPVRLGVAAYANDASLPVRALAGPMFPNIVQWNEYDHGGHFPAMEVPDLFTEDLRQFATALTAKAMS